MSEFDLIVVGGGAAGMFAAVTAASFHKSVLLIEKNQRLGRKLAITGKGRCNVTNDCSAEEVLKNVLRNPRFLYSALDRFGTSDIVRFFEERGVPLKTERGNRVFPVSGSAYDIVDALSIALKDAGVVRFTGAVTDLLVSDGAVRGVRASGRAFSSGRVILATGGLSYPVTGSTGDGYLLAEHAGHTVLETEGSLVPLEFEGEECRGLAGLSLRNIGLKLYGKKKKPLFTDFGEALFMPYGMSGPVILSASANMDEKNGPYTVELDLKPALEDGRLDDRMLRDFAARSNETIASCLRGLLPAQLVTLVLARTHISPSRPVNTISREERRAMLETMKHLRFRVAGKRPVAEAIVTRGGIKTAEINPKTMESKLVSGLYFAGEIIDCDAYTGGFNLQIAWSTAFCAGTSCGNPEPSVL